MNPDRKEEPTPFLSLLQILATHAMAAMGAGGPNERNELYLDLEFAAHVIDILHDLDEKTKGRRTPEEDAAIAETLSALQLSFVRVSDLAVRAARGRAGAGTVAASESVQQAPEPAPTRTAPSSGTAQGSSPTDSEQDRPPRFQKKYG